MPRERSDRGSVWGMQPRALKRLMQLAEPERLDVIAEGLGLLAEHVATLREDVLHLAEADRPRGLAVLSAQSEEEAAKVLILLDLVRMNWRDHEAVSRQVGRFYYHLARCIYVDATQMRPADFREATARRVLALRELVASVEAQASTA
jgi:hypothetical protein